MKLQKSITYLSTAFLLSACGNDSAPNEIPESSGKYETCSAPDQNERFFNYMKDEYLWADQLQDNLDPEAFDDVYAVLEELRVPEDTYSFIMTEEEYEQMYVNATYFGVGFSMEQISESRIKIRFVYDGSPAATAGIARGDEIIAVEGEAVSELLANGQFDDALGANEQGVDKEITWQKPNGTQTTEVLSKVEVETNTVMGTQTYPVNGETVGYFTLDSFINRTGSDLNTAFDQFAADNIDHLVIDVRYNGGGLIRYANQAATQVGGTNVEGENLFTIPF